MKFIRYEEGYKYQLAEDYICQTGIRGFVVEHYWFRLAADGTLWIRKGYAWDGPSGPTIDTKSFMRGSLVHDVLYQMMRLELLPQSCFTPANRELQKICLEDGMWRVRAWYVFRSVERFGGVHAALAPEKILTAP